MCVKAQASHVRAFTQPLTIAQLAQAPADDETEFEVPVLQLPAMPGDVRGASRGLHAEAGAAGMLQVMGPSSLASGVHSEAGSHSLGSELGRTYEDEDTWYDFSHAYAAGPDTFLAPETDAGACT